MKRIHHLPICIFLIFSLISFGARAQAKSCIITAKQFVALVTSNTDEIETILMPCFSVQSFAYRRDYARPGHTIDHYEIFNFSRKDDLDGYEVGFHTTNVEAYTKYKNALKAYGFRYDAGTTAYKLKTYIMLTGSVTNKDGNTDYWISMYKLK